MRLGGAAVTLQPRIGGDQPLPFVDSFSASEVAEWVGTGELPAHHSRELQLETWITFSPNADLYGRTGTHRADWAFAYNGGRDSARYSVECTEAVKYTSFTVEDTRRRRRVAGVQLSVDGRTATTAKLIGTASFPNLVIGRHRVAVRGRYYAPLDTIVETRGYFGPNLRVTRTAPELDSLRAGWPLPPESEKWVDLYHPAGTGALPDSLTITLTDAALSPARVWTISPSGSDLDAMRRRYALPGDVIAATQLHFDIPAVDGDPVRVICDHPGRNAPWFCREP